MTNGPMIRNKLLNPQQQKMVYESPAAELFSLEIKVPIVASNTEPIDEDDDEYEWV